MRLLPLIGLWILVLSVLGCADIRENSQVTQFQQVDSPGGVTVYYDRDIQSIFTQSCTGGCHESGGTGVLQAGLDLTENESYAELLDVTRSKNGPQVVPGDADNSILVWKVLGVDAAGRTVYGDPMPQGRPMLASADLLKIRTWINKGALWSVAPLSPPSILSSGVRDSVTVEVTFDQALSASSVVDLTRYRLEDGDGTILSVVAVDAVGDRLTLTTEPLSPGVLYTLSVVGLVGETGLPIVTAEFSEIRYNPIVDYATQIQPVFDQSCAFVGCHAASRPFPPGAGLVLTSDVSRQSLVGVEADQVAGAFRVVAGSPDTSYLIDKMTGMGIVGDQMPVGGPFLTPVEIEVFRLWIEQESSGD